MSGGGVTSKHSHPNATHYGNASKPRASELREVVQSSVIRGTFVTLYKDAQGSFLSLEAANDVTNQILQKNAASVDAVANGSQD
jgi:hypothetical protein